MFDDPIVEEVRKHRQERAARFAFDVRAIARDARSREGADGRKVIPCPRRRKDGHRKEEG